TAAAPSASSQVATRGARSERTVLVTMCVGYFLVLLDVTIVNVALPQIGSALHTQVSGLQWVVDAYALALAALMLAGGTIGDLRGHKRVVLIGLAVFGLGSLGCALAPNVAALAAGRAVQGVGAALLLPGTLAIVSQTFPDRRAQARAIGVWAGVGSLALPAGPLLGGALIAAFGWRAVFMINVPIVLLAIAACVVVVKESVQPGTRRLDAAGAVLGALFLLALTFAFIEGGRSGVARPGVVTAAACSVALLSAFVLVERRRGEQAMLPLALFRHRAFSAANAAAGAMNLGTLGTLFVLTLFLQSVQHRSALNAGLSLVPLFAPLAILAPLAGRLTSRIGSRLPTVAGLTVAAGGLALLPAFLLWGIGIGVLTPAVVAAAIAAVPERREGLASAVNNTARQAAGAIGIAVAGAMAGQPGNAGFTAGFHTVALLAACLYVLTAAAARFLIPGKQAASGYPSGMTNFSEDE